MMENGYFLCTLAVTDILPNNQYLSEGLKFQLYDIKKFFLTKGSSGPFQPAT